MIDIKEAFDNDIPKDLIIDMREAFSNDIPKIPGWESPVELVTSAVSEMSKQIDDQIMYEITTQLGVNVDKDRLIECMRHSQEEYHKGIHAGIKWVLDMMEQIDNSPNIRDYQLKWEFVKEQVKNHEVL